MPEFFFIVLIVLINDGLSVPEKEIAQKLVRKGKRNVNIAVVGLAKSGKTTFIKALCRNKECINEKLRQTNEVVCFDAGDNHGVNIRLIDTPGFCQLGGKGSEQILHEMMDAVNVEETGSKGVDLIVYCIKMKRLDKELKDTFMAMKDNVPNAWKKTIIVLLFANEEESIETKCDELSSDIRHALDSLNIDSNVVPIFDAQYATPQYDLSPSSLNLFWERSFQQIYESIEQQQLFSYREWDSMQEQEQEPEQGHAGTGCEDKV